MAWSLDDLRFQWRRIAGIVRRGWASLRSRGLRATWQRLAEQWRHRAVADRPPPPLLPPQTPAVPAALPCSAAPRVSIVIPVYDHLADTLRCLRALAAHPPADCEVIVVDDGSGDDSQHLLPAIPGLRYHRRDCNGGFIAACNDGAALARGAVLVFLNNDTIPQPGWLDALLDTFSQYPRAGLVGAQLRDLDGRLQEAGGVVFADGSAWNYGRGGVAADPRFAYLRDADYLSGAAIAIPRAVFQSLGGFDPIYAPAYYEDTDLAFRLRAAGWRVLYQPAAVVVHIEGVTAGTDPTRGVKAYQVRNRTRFAARHADALTLQLPAATVPTPGLLHRRQRQILIIDAATPTPDRDSGSLRLLNLMQLLCEEGAHVVFLPADRAHAPGYTEALQRLGVETWYQPFVGRISAWLRRHGPRFATAMVCRHHVAHSLLPLLRRHAPQARLVFDTIDLHYLRERRGAQISGDAALARAAERTRAAELAVIAASDLTLVVSERERELLAGDAPQARVRVVSNLHRPAGPGRPYAERRDLVFVGGFRHPPNVDAVQWFVEQVFADLRRHLPEVRLHCIGAHPPPAIVALGRRPGVQVHGHVADLAPYMDGCRVALAPLRYGAGVKGKVNLSMAHGQPVVATAIAAEGMHLRDGEDVLIADTAADFAAAVLRLYRDEALWQTLAANGLDNVRRHFSPDAARPTVREVFLDVDA